MALKQRTKFPQFANALGQRAVRSTANMGIGRFMKRLSDREYYTLMNKPDVQEAMRYRCEEEHHDYENCCSAFLHVYQECKWCGARR